MKNYGSYSYNEELANSLFSAFNNSYSDKGSSHNYHIVYSHILDGREINNFLEVGLFLNELQHTDLNAWASIYPSANIYGADIKREQLFDSGNIKTFYADQSDVASLEALKAEIDVEFDVIIDDASHMYGSTISAFNSLFPAVKSGGVYIIEDVLDNGEGGNGWQQKLTDIETFLVNSGYTYEVFQALEPSKVIDQETGEPTDVDAASDSYIVCVYKN